MNTEASTQDAISHALWEAHACMGQWAFCATRAMLRKALELWSADYRDRHQMIFDESQGERDNLYWRLRKIAEENKLYADAIAEAMDKLRIDANQALHDPVVCAGGRSGSYDGLAIEAIRRPYQDLHRLVSQMIATTLPTTRVVHSDTNRWKKEP